MTQTYRRFSFFGVILVPPLESFFVSTNCKFTVSCPVSNRRNICLLKHIHNAFEWKTKATHRRNGTFGHNNVIHFATLFLVNLHFSHRLSPVITASVNSDRYLCSNNPIILFRQSCKCFIYFTYSCYLRIFFVVLPESYS